MFFIISIFVICYLLGAIPFGYLIVKGFTGKNILEYGTSNIGTMNTHRATNNKYLTLLVFLADFGKGYLSFWIGNFLASVFGVLNFTTIVILGVAGFALVLGHNYSIFMKFQGGKGLAAGCGFMFGLNPVLILIWCGLFLVTVGISKYMVLGQMLATIGLLLITLFINQAQFWIVLGLGILVILKHAPRMQNVLNGTEPKMYYKNKN